MKMGTRFALICVLHLLVVSHSESREIYVDPVHGVLNQSCWDGGEALPCQTIEKALDGMINQTTILIKSGNYSLQANSSAGFEFWNMSDLAIMAIGNDTTLSHQLPVIVECEGDTGLTFVYSQNITIRGIVFAGCGVLRNSTSKSSEAISFEQFYASFYFLFCEDVRISFVNVTRSAGIGMAIYSTVGTNMIEYSNFSYNPWPADQNSTNGGGLYIEFSYCTPDRYKDVDCSKEGNVPLHYSMYALYTIYQSVFHNNSANITNSVNSTFILPQRDNHQAFGRGGGLSVFFKGNAMNNTIIVNESCFQNNTAIYGAGVFVEYQDWSQHNTFEMHSSRLESNWCYNYDSDVSGTGGGGSRVGYIFFDETHAHNNAILFYSCHFSKNLAYFGGGLSFYTAREPKEAIPTNTLEFHDCEWRENTARVGSALDLAVWHAVTIGVTVEARLTNCNFFNNSASYTTKSGSIVTTQSIVGVGAFYTDSIPVYLHGDFTFEQNNHSALAAVSTGIYFQENSQVHFVGNTGRTGGAIALLGYAFIQTTDGVHLQFVNNSAEVQGGAIFAQSIGEHDLISSRNCFFRYKDITATPLQWNCSFYFENNTAKGIANSIYATSLLTCLWGGAYGSAQGIPNEVFCWNDDHNPNRWEYSPGNCSTEISTSPASFNGSSYNISVVPGERHPLPITMLDDRGNNVTDETVFTARALTQTVSVDNTSQYISDNTIEIHGEPFSKGSLLLETQDPLVLSTEVTVAMQPCPPGMITVGSGNSAVCRCSTGNYGGLVHCSDTEFQAKMRRGGWMGQYPQDPQNRHPPMAAGECPYCSQITDKQSFNLTQNMLEPKNSLCLKINRMELCVESAWMAMDHL